MKVLTEQEYSALVDKLILNSTYYGTNTSHLYYKALGFEYSFFKHSTRIVYFYYISFVAPDKYGRLFTYHFWLKVDPTRHKNKYQLKTCSTEAYDGIRSHYNIANFSNFQDNKFRDHTSYHERLLKDSLVKKKKHKFQRL